MMKPTLFIFCVVFSTHAANSLSPQLASIDQSSWHKRRKDKETKEHTKAIRNKEAQEYTKALRELMKHVGNKREIDKSVKQQIEALGYTEKDLNNGELKGNTFSGKIIQCVIFGLIAWIGLWLMGLGNTFFWLIGICWSGFWLLCVIASVLHLP